MQVKVKDGRIGYYAHERRKSGQVFTISDPSHFSDKWMEKVEGRRDGASLGEVSEAEVKRGVGRPRKEE